MELNLELEEEVSINVGRGAGPRGVTPHMDILRAVKLRGDSRELYDTQPSAHCSPCALLVARPRDGH